MSIALVDYGILHPDTHEFRIGHLVTWLRANRARPAQAAETAETTSGVGAGAGTAS